MAVETFFLFGFRAFSDVIKDIFHPRNDNLIAQLITKLESNEVKQDDFLKILKSLLVCFKEIAFEDKELKFHLIKQLEPAFGHMAIIKMDPIPPIAMKINRTSDIFEITLATQEEIKDSPAIIFPLKLFKSFLIDDLDVLKLITDDKIDIEKFEELNEIIVRALLGFTSAYFLRPQFQERARKELINLVRNLI